MLKKGLAPMTADMAGTETVRLGMKIGGDEGKDVQRDAVDVNEGVLPLADICQRGRDILVESGDFIKSGAVNEIGVLL